VVAEGDGMVGRGEAARVGADQQVAEVDCGGVTPRQILADIASFLASQACMYDSGGGHPDWGHSTTHKFARLVSNILAHAIDRQFNTPEGWNLPFPILPNPCRPANCAAWCACTSTIAPAGQ